MSLGGKKLVILGIPWDVDSEGLRQYMSRFGELLDAMVMKDRASGRSRGFGYVTFSSLEDAEKVLAVQHNINGRTLDIKVATPKEEMVSSSKNCTRIFVARIPLSVIDEDFHSYFMKYGPVVDAYMPKDPVTKQHRGIGFVTYENPESVEKLTLETHELGGSTIAVDRANPKEDSSRGYRVSNHYRKMPHAFMPSSSSYNKTDSYTTTAISDHQTNKFLSSVVQSTQEGPSVGCAITVGSSLATGADYGQSVEGASTRVGKKMFVGRIPVEATSQDLHAYFCQFGLVLDVYLPKDARKISHRGFAFVTFADEASATRVARLRHFIHGREIAVDFASPADHGPGTRPIPVNHVPYYGGQQNLPTSEAVVAATIEYDSSVQPLSSSNTKWGKKLFIGRIPIEATAIDLRLHFSQFGHVTDVYLPKDDTKRSHRGFGFVTFADEISAEYASRKIHSILGQKIVLDRAAPIENEGVSTESSSNVIARTLDGSILKEQDLSSQQIYDNKFIPSRRPIRTSLRYNPY